MKFIDTNIFVYFADGRDRKKQSVARAVLSEAIGNPQYVVSSQVMNEFANVAMKKLSMTEDEVRQYVESFLGVRVVMQQQVWTLRALEIKKQHGLQFYDSLMLAAAEDAGCSEFLTEDLNDGQMYGGVKAVNPFKGL